MIKSLSPGGKSNVTMIRRQLRSDKSQKDKAEAAGKKNVALKAPITDTPAARTRNKRNMNKAKN